MASTKRQAGGMPKQPGLAKHDSAVLDLAFALDCTASMGSYIETARRNIKNIVEAIVASETSDVRLGLVEYRDHPPNEATFVTRPHDFTSSVSSVRKWLVGCNAVGGGDVPEAVTDALHEVLKLSWRDNATKICILISDAPPHGLHSDIDTFPNGCPAGLDPMAIVRNMAEKGITLYCVGCEPAIIPYKEFFTAIAFLTGGQYVPLRSANALTQIIIGGAQEEMSLEKWMAEVDREVQEKTENGKEVDEKVVAKKIAAKLKKKGAKCKTLKKNNVALQEASMFSIVLSKCKSMAQIKGKFKLPEWSLFAVPKTKTTTTSKGKKPCKKKSVSKKKGEKGKSTSCRKRTSTKTAGKEDSVYKAVESTISHSQILRMVRKSKARKGTK